MSGGGQQEVVMLFNSEGSVSDEMLFSTFEDLLAGKQTLDAYAASSTKAAFCLVGNGLSLRGVVYFLLNVDEEGRVDPTFNLPLHYLVKHAGVAEDLGRGGIRKASRGQCPVPWQAVNLWEPDEKHGIECLQSQIFRNKLKLKASTGCVVEDVAGSADDIELVEDTSSSDLEFTFGEQETQQETQQEAQQEDEQGAEVNESSNGGESLHKFEAEPLPDLEDEMFERPQPMPKPAPRPVPRPDARSESSPDAGIEPANPPAPATPRNKPERGPISKLEFRSEIKPVPMPVVRNVELGAKLTEVFGEAGKVSMPDLIRLHTEQLNQVKAKHREDVEQQQLGYLDQLRACREEIHSLKVSLRQEQGRNRRLEQMLRSDL